MVEVDEHVWLSRHCPDHGLIRTMLYGSLGYLTMAKTSMPPSGRRRCLIVDVTERCDVGCKTCSASSTSLGSEKLAADLVRDAIASARVIGARVVALSGGEPLMRSDIWEVADAFHASIPKVVLITSGRNFESDPRILAEMGVRREWLEVYLQFDSLQDSVLKAIRTPQMNATLRRQRLGLAVATGAAITAVCVVPPDASEESIAEIAVFCRDEGAAGITFQPLRQIGRFPKMTNPSTTMTTVDYIQGVALRALLADDAVPKPFRQQPFDISLAFLAGSQTVLSDAFFGEGRPGHLFRVASSSYWDHTNYFEPFTRSGKFYFFSDSETPLNARYFGEAGRVSPALQ
jgi:molybdenum cofactor biosynthesis enzyme MoaA